MHHAGDTRSRVNSEFSRSRPLSARMNTAHERSAGAPRPMATAAQMLNSESIFSVCSSARQSHFRFYLY